MILNSSVNNSSWYLLGSLRIHAFLSAEANLRIWNIGILVLERFTEAGRVYIRISLLSFTHVSQLLTAINILSNFKSYRCKIAQKALETKNYKATKRLTFTGIFEVFYIVWFCRLLNGLIFKLKRIY